MYPVAQIMTDMVMTDSLESMNQSCGTMNIAYRTAMRIAMSPIAVWTSTCLRFNAFSDHVRPKRRWSFRLCSAPSENSRAPGKQKV